MSFSQHRIHERRDYALEARVREARARLFRDEMPLYAWPLYQRVMAARVEQDYRLKGGARW